MQIATSMNREDEEMKNMLDSLQVFIEHLDELVGVFENDYNGGDFCAGLKFGYSGSNLLFTIAQTIIHTTIRTMGDKYPLQMQPNQANCEQSYASILKHSWTSLTWSLSYTNFEFDENT